MIELFSSQNIYIQYTILILIYLIIAFVVLLVFGYTSYKYYPSNGWGNIFGILFSAAIIYLSHEFILNKFSIIGQINTF